MREAPAEAGGGAPQDSSASWWGSATPVPRPGAEGRAADGPGADGRAADGRAADGPAGDAEPDPAGGEERADGPEPPPATGDPVLATAWKKSSAILAEWAATGAIEPEEAAKATGTTEVPAPTTAVPGPTTAIPGPTTAVSRPASAVRAPGTAVPAPPERRSEPARPGAARPPAGGDAAAPPVEITRRPPTARPQHRLEHMTRPEPAPRVDAARAQPAAPHRPPEPYRPPEPHRPPVAPEPPRVPQAPATPPPPRSSQAPATPPPAMPWGNQEPPVEAPARTAPTSAPPPPAPPLRAVPSLPADEDRSRPSRLRALPPLSQPETASRPTQLRAVPPLAAPDTAPHRPQPASPAPDSRPTAPQSRPPGPESRPAAYESQQPASQPQQPAPQPSPPVREPRPPAPESPFAAFEPRAAAGQPRVETPPPPAQPRVPQGEPEPPVGAPGGPSRPTAGRGGSSNRVTPTHEREARIFGPDAHIFEPQAPARDRDSAQFEPESRVIEPQASARGSTFAPESRVIEPTAPREPTLTPLRVVPPPDTAPPPATVPHPAAPHATAPDVAAPALPDPDRRPAPARRRDAVAPVAEPPRRPEATARLAEASAAVADTYARVETAPREPLVAPGGTKTVPTRPEPTRRLRPQARPGPQARPDPHPLADVDIALAAPARVEPRHRLHPITPLLRGVRMLAIVIAIFSWQGYQELGPVRWALGASAVLAVALALAAISWLTTGYQILGRELRISEGVLWRRTRAIPLERLQTVDVVRPMMARLAGVAELRLEVVGAPRAEAPLAYLSTSAASRLREHLLGLAGTPSNRRFQHTADRVVHLGSNGQVVLAHLMTPHAFFAPLILSLTLTPTLEQSRFTFVAIGSMLTATVGIVQVPIRRILDEWNFRLREDDKGLRLRHGLLGTRSQTVPRQRIQAVGVTWPLMWRPFGWLKARMDVAGYGHHDRDVNMHAGVLLPVADGDTARQVLADVLDADLLTLPVSPVPQRAKWLAPLRYRMLAVGHDREMVYARDGWLVPKLVIAPLARAQSVRVVQGPIQRLLGLADVHVDTAGRLHVVGEHRDADEAYALAATLASAARAARARELGAHHRSNTTATANANPT